MAFSTARKGGIARAKGRGIEGRRSVLQGARLAALRAYGYRIRWVSGGPLRISTEGGLIVLLQLNVHLHILSSFHSDLIVYYSGESKGHGKNGGRKLLMPKL